MVYYHDWLLVFRPGDSQSQSDRLGRLMAEQFAKQDNLRCGNKLNL